MKQLSIAFVLAASGCETHDASGFEPDIYADDGQDEDQYDDDIVERSADFPPIGECTPGQTKTWWENKKKCVYKGRWLASGQCTPHETALGDGVWCTGSVPYIGRTTYRQQKCTVTCMAGGIWGIPKVAVTAPNCASSLTYTSCYSAPGSCSMSGSNTKEAFSMENCRNQCQGWVQSHCGGPYCNLNSSSTLSNNCSVIP